MEEEQIIKMGYAIQDFLRKSKNQDLKPKDLMPVLIEKGYFQKDHRAGLPLRDILRRLHEENKLYLLPQASYVKKEVNKFWFFNLLEQ